MLKRSACCLVAAVLFIHMDGLSQSIDTLSKKVGTVSSKFFDQTASGASASDRGLTRQTAAYLNQLSATDARLLRQMRRVDSNADKHLPQANYQQWIQALRDTSALKAGRAKTYIARLDTLRTTLNFLQSGAGNGSVPSASTGELAKASAQVQLLQAHIDQSALISQYLTQRRQQIAQYLGQFSQLPSGVLQTFNRYKATAYYYRQQVDALKKSLNDPQKIQQQAVTQLAKLPAYQQFLASHSMLATLFRLPPGYASGSALQGLQTKSQIQEQMQQQVGSGGQGGQALDQQVQQAKRKIDGMEASLSKYGAGGQEVDMPDFKPNSQRTKNFFGRLTYGLNVQLAKSTTYYPATGNLGLSAGYKLNDNSSFGVGVSYAIGLGSGWNHMQFSSQGIGLRSYMDWKIKKTYYVVGGYEESYLRSFSSIAQLQNRSVWQPSALIGLEKKYKLSARLQGNIQLLFDALYRQEVPQGQMIRLRVGYNF